MIVTVYSDWQTEYRLVRLQNVDLVHKAQTECHFIDFKVLQVPSHDSSIYELHTYLNRIRQVWSAILVSALPFTEILDLSQKGIGLLIVLT